jgi:molybdenum cofactor biosynthesis enzyme MoaA
VPALRAAGITRLSVRLDTLDPLLFAKIAKRGAPDLSIRCPAPALAGPVVFDLDQ